MTDADDYKAPVQSFQDDVMGVLAKYRAAHLLSVAEAVGVMHMVADQILRDARDEDDE